MGTPDSAGFGDLLRRFRLAAGLSQEALAEKAGLSGDAIRALERGRRTAPRPDTLAMLYQALELAPAERAMLANAVGQTPSNPTPIHVDARPVCNLPILPAPLIGRERLREEATNLILHSGCRLLSLTGPGGVGKTSLAVAIATSLRDEFDDGVYFVDLAPMRDPSLAALAMVQMLGLREAGANDARSLLLAHLRTRRTLFVLDNLEHLLGVAPLVAEINETCPRVVMLVTSRTPLHVRAEQRFPIPPLETPIVQHSGVEQIVEFDAVRLFLTRARAAKPDFEITVANATTIAEICTRLDGLPLAIELAAARVTLLTPSALLRRLEKSLSILTDGPRDLPVRHQTLRAAIDWSYELLSPEEQALFRRMSVFVAGCTLEAVEQICADRDLNDGSTLNRLTVLVENNLLRAASDSNDDDGMRLSMLETVREYAVERLELSGESDHYHRSHAEYFMDLAEEAAPQLLGPLQVRWLERLDREHDNLRAGLAWAQKRGLTEVGLRISGALWRFWWTRGYLSEGRRWFDTFLSDETSASLPVQATALSGAGILAWAQGDLDHAVRFHQTALATWRELDDAFGVAKALNNLGLVTMEQRRPADAIRLYEESLALHRSVGNQRSVAGALLNLGSALLMAGEYERAEEVLDETLKLYRELDDQWGIADSLHYLGALACDTGQYARAAGRLRESLSHFRSIGDRPGIATCLEYLAAVAVANGQPDWASRLLGAAGGLRTSLAVPVQVSERDRFDSTVASIIASIGDEQFSAGWAEGGASPLNAVIDGALGREDLPCPADVS
jgi:predicted ATPase/DNA-binding XRE family transcriptional regulator